MKNDKMELISNLIETEAEKDSIEIGSAGNRIKIYLNFSDPEKARQKIEMALGGREYANMLLDPNQEVDMDKVESFLKSSVPDEEGSDEGE